jgi:hypothetical protein
VGWKWAKGKLTIAVNQLQPEPAFPNPLPIEIATAAGKQRIIIHPKAKEMNEVFRVVRKPMSIEVDPDNSILKEVSLKHTVRTVSR